MQENKKATVIILTFNSEKYIKACLTSLQSQTYKNYSIQVVDNNSTDHTLEIIKEKFPDVDVVANKKNIGFARGNNLAIKKALKEKADYVVLLNHDTQVEPNFLEAGIKAITDPQIGLASPTILYANTDKIWWAGSEIYRHREILSFHTTKIGEHKNKEQTYIKPISDTLTTDWVPACALFIKQATLNKIGLLDESFFMYGEDVDWSLRAAKSNYKLVHFTTTTVYHDVAIKETREFSGYLIKKIFWKMSARLKIVLRYFTFREIVYYFLKILYLPIHYVIGR